MSTATQFAIERSNFLPGLAFTLAVSAGLSLFLVPAAIIRPFRGQSPKMLSLAMAIRQEAPLWTLVIAGFVIIVAVLLWRRVSRWKRALLIMGVLLASGSAVMARVNYFEWMFHPVTAPGFEKAADVKLDASEMVMAVRFGADARAYPIRAMAYHHVVNDVVAGVPIAVTY